MRTGFVFFASSGPIVKLLSAAAGSLLLTATGCAVDEVDTDLEIAEEVNAPLPREKRISFENRGNGAYDQVAAEQDFGDQGSAGNWAENVGHRAKIYPYGVGHTKGLSLLLPKDPPRKGWEGNDPDRWQSFTNLGFVFTSAPRRYLQWDMKLEQRFDFDSGGIVHETKLGGMRSGTNACRACNNAACDKAFSVRFILRSGGGERAHIRPYVYGNFNRAGRCGQEFWRRPDNARFDVEKSAWYTLRVEVKLGDQPEASVDKDHLPMRVKRTGGGSWKRLLDQPMDPRGNSSIGVEKASLEFARGGEGGLQVAEDSYLGVDNIEWGTL
jgi:hypothetical protein